MGRLGQGSAGLPGRDHPAHGARPRRNSIKRLTDNHIAEDFNLFSDVCLLHYLSYWPGFLDIIFLIGGFSLSISRIDEFFVSYFSQATT